MNAIIDTLRMAKAFEDAGFVKAQADSLAITIADATGAAREDLVTQGVLKSELALTRAELRAEIASVKSELRAEIASVKSELRAEIASVKNDLIRWVLGSQVMLVVVLVALSNFTRAFS